ncbi:unnamed protein product [Caenorhabditis angaria]|uniref:Uncharacterized protein n=1 Tax=Caenorhabditis angaria TaxID=860376 RepID=A0A9P1NA01_9PELO|nr:unnamed protein product [Caenorhabditis angaria]
MNPFRFLASSQDASAFPRDFSESHFQNPPQDPSLLQAPKQNPLKRAHDFSDLFFIQAEPPAKLAKKLEEIDKSQFINHQDILFMEDFMEEVNISPIDISFGYQGCFKIKRSIIFKTLQPELYMHCVDVILRRSLSIVKGDLNLRLIDVRFIHPQLPQGQKCFFNKTFSRKNVQEMVNELILAEKQNPKFGFDENLQIHIAIINRTKYVLGENNTLLKAIAICLSYELQKTDKSFYINFAYLLQEEQQQDQAVEFLLKKYILIPIDFTIQTMPLIAEKMVDYEIIVITKDSRLIFNEGQAKCITLAEINGKFDAVI